MVVTSLLPVLRAVEVVGPTPEVAVRVRGASPDAGLLPGEETGLPSDGVSRAEVVGPRRPTPLP